MLKFIKRQISYLLHLHTVKLRIEVPRLSWLFCLFDMGAKTCTCGGKWVGRPGGKRDRPSFKLAHAESCRQTFCGAQLRAVPPPTCRCHHAASTCDLLGMSVTSAFCLMRLCLSKRMSLSWSVAAMAGFNGSDSQRSHNSSQQLHNCKNWLLQLFISWMWPAADG